MSTVTSRNVRRPLLAVALAAFASLCVAFAPAASPRDDGPLHDAMEELGDHLKTIVKSLDDPEAKDARLAAVARMQSLVLVAKLEQPSNMAETPEAERAAHAVAFRRDLAKLLGELADLELELIDDENDAAMERIKGSLYTLREAAHARYRKPKRR